MGSRALWTLLLLVGASALFGLAATALPAFTTQLFVAYGVLAGVVVLLGASTGRGFVGGSAARGAA
jgi:hypothetical protein